MNELIRLIMYGEWSVFIQPHSRWDGKLVSKYYTWYDGGHYSLRVLWVSVYVFC